MTKSMEDNNSNYFNLNDYGAYSFKKGELGSFQEVRYIEGRGFVSFSDESLFFIKNLGLKPRSSRTTLCDLC
jgi:hypothetical protein